MTLHRKLSAVFWTNGTKSISCTEGGSACFILVNLSVTFLLQSSRRQLFCLSMPCESAV